MEISQQRISERIGKHVEEIWKLCSQIREMIMAIPQKCFSERVGKQKADLPCQMLGPAFSGRPRNLADARNRSRV